MVASTAEPWLRDPLGDELRQRPMLRLAFGNPGFDLLVLSLRRLFKTDAALSGVLPNPLSPAGYFPSEAIYLLHFRRKLQSLIFFFFFLPHRRGSQPSQITPGVSTCQRARGHCWGAGARHPALQVMGWRGLEGSCNAA